MGERPEIEGLLEEQKNPNFAVALAYIDGNGKVVRFTKLDGTDFVDADYGEANDHPNYPDNETKRIPGNAILITPNYCRWVLIAGRWRCV